MPTRRTARRSSNWYVTATDKFLSGWGYATGKIHKLIVICKDHQQAEYVADNMRKDRTLSYINVSPREPRYSSTRYTTKTMLAKDAPLWSK